MCSSCSRFLVGKGFSSVRGFAKSLINIYGYYACQFLRLFAQSVARLLERFLKILNILVLVLMILKGKQTKREYLIDARLWVLAIL